MPLLLILIIIVIILQIGAQCKWRSGKNEVLSKTGRGPARAPHARCGRRRNRLERCRIAASLPTRAPAARGEAPREAHSPAGKVWQRFSPHPPVRAETTPRRSAPLHERPARPASLPARQSKACASIFSCAAICESPTLLTTRAPSCSAQMPGTLCVPASPASGVNSGICARSDRLPVPPASRGSECMPADQHARPLRDRRATCAPACTKTPQEAFSETPAESLPTASDRESAAPPRSRHSAAISSTGRT